MSLRFLAFTDLHHEPATFLHDAPAFMRTILARGREAGASFAIQLGDFLRNLPENGWLADEYAEEALPTYNVFGNHDTDRDEMPRILEMYRLERSYYHFDCEGYRFIALDPNYSWVDGEVRHYAPGVSQGAGYIPREQIAWLEATVAESPYPCILCSHQSLERTDGVSNRDEVWRIICAANRRKPRSVILCINGHYHNDYCTVVNGVCCLDLNSSSYYWCGVEHALYPQEICEKYPLSTHCLYYMEPLSAVITLEGADRIRIEGTKGAYVTPISREELLRVDQGRLSEERLCSPSVRSYEVELTTGSVTIIEKENPS
jgi:hypothetical protein